MLLLILSSSGTTEIKTSDAFATITDEKVADSTYRRISVLTIENKTPLYNGDVKCAAKFTNPEAFEVSSSMELNTIGASLDKNTFSSGDGSAAISCVVWGDNAPAAVTFEKADGTLIEDVANKVP